MTSKGAQGNKGRGSWEGLLMFLLTVDGGQWFLLTRTALSEESEVGELIAPHKTISAACVDLLLPRGNLEHKSSQPKVSLEFFHFRKIQPSHSPSTSTRESEKLY